MVVSFSESIDTRKYTMCRDTFFSELQRYSFDAFRESVQSSPQCELKSVDRKRYSPDKA